MVPEFKKITEVWPTISTVLLLSNVMFIVVCSTGYAQGVLEYFDHYRFFIGYPDVAHDVKLKVVKSALPADVVPYSVNDSIQDISFNDYWDPKSNKTDDNVNSQIVFGFIGPDNYFDFSPGWLGYSFTYEYLAIKHLDGGRGNSFLSLNNHGNTVNGYQITAVPLFFWSPLNFKYLNLKIGTGWGIGYTSLSGTADIGQKYNTQGQLEINNINFEVTGWTIKNSIIVSLEFLRYFMFKVERHVSSFIPGNYKRSPEYINKDRESFPLGNFEENSKSNIRSSEIGFYLLIHF